MQTFYSLVKVGFNSSTNDTITIGVIVLNGKKFSCFFSDKRKKIASRLVRLESSTVDIDFLVTQIISKSSTNKEFGEEYFLYLSNYCNGLLQFSAPNPVAAPFNEETLAFLVKMIFSESSVKEKELKEIEDKKENKNVLLKEKIEKELIQPLKNKIHTHYKFEPINLPIPFSFELDCIGQNGVLIGAKTENFDTDKRTLNRHFSNYLALISTLSNKYNSPLSQNSFFWIAEEPQLTDKKKHLIWETAHKNPLLKLIHPDEVNKIVELVKDKKATRFL